MKVKIKKIYPGAKTPAKAHITDAGFDLYAHSKSYDTDGNVVYGCGIAFEIPEGYVGLIFPRSSNAKKELILSNSVGVVDSGYRGEVLFKFKPACVLDEPNVAYLPETYKVYDVGDRIGQIIIMPYPEIEFVEVEELSESDRGTCGYGSSGK